MREKRETQDDLATIEKALAGGLVADSTAFRIRLEIRKDELADYCMRLNQHEIWLREHMPQAYEVEIDRWARFSEYGISTINFSRIQDIDVRIRDISGLVTQLDQVYRRKKAELGMRIDDLLGDVNRIETQMRDEMQKKQKEANDRFLKNEYFDPGGKETPAARIETPRSEKEARP